MFPQALLNSSFSSHYPSSSSFVLTAVASCISHSLSSSSSSRSSLGNFLFLLHKEQKYLVAAISCTRLFFALITTTSLLMEEDILSQAEEEFLVLLKERNARESVPFEHVYEEYSSIMQENQGHLAQLLDVDRAIVEFQSAIREVGTEFVDASVVQAGLRNLLEIVRGRHRSMEKDRSTWTFFHSQRSELMNIKEELQCAKTEIHRLHEKTANYEEDVERYKKDIETACDEIVSLKEIIAKQNV